MIKQLSLKEIFQYILSDYTRYYGNGGGKNKVSYFKAIFKALTRRNLCYTYSFWFRLASFKNPFYYLARVKHYTFSRKWGIQIPAGTKIGYGFYIGHGVGIVINGGTVIGNNCNVSQFLSIGTNKRTPATIGDNVYIGPNVCIVEDVKIGNNVTIGAGAVVTKDIPDNATAAGAPAKVLNYDNPGVYVIHRYNREICRCNETL